MILVIGYGNTLCSDDGVGPRVAEGVAAWHLPRVKTIITHQLAPELADEIARADMVIFVDADASCAPDMQGVVIESMGAATAGSLTMTHVAHSRDLLALVATLYHHQPPAVLVSVPAIHFELGETLSACAERGLADALRAIRVLIDTAGDAAQDPGCGPTNRGERSANAYA